MTTAPDHELSSEDILPMVQGLLDSESDSIANMANLAALLFEALPEVNWVGFYRLCGNELVLGPFQGRVACTRIPLGKGVCGTSAGTGSVQRVADVHAFPGHIACDSASESEIVVPVFRNGEVYGVLDIDSPVRNRFSEDDQKMLEAVVSLLETRL